jgi:hypothetical protein
MALVWKIFTAGNEQPARAGTQSNGREARHRDSNSQQHVSKNTRDRLTLLRAITRQELDLGLVAKLPCDEQSEDAMTR